MEMINALGRRKASIARVFVKNGDGKIVINGKSVKDYFPQIHIGSKVTEPFEVAGVENTFDIRVNVKGGGFKGQAEAVRLGIARALVKINEDFKKPLKEKKLLTRDARVVERKKFGRPKARKAFQFSKR